MPYEIGQLYEIGDGTYMIGEQYQIGAGGGLVPAQQYGQLQMRAPQQMAPQVVPFVQMPRPTIVSRSDPTKSNIQPLGCNQLTPIGVGLIGDATVSPQKIFKAERFTVPATVAPDFMINGIFVGVDRQSPGLSAIPAEAFLPDSIYSNVDFTTSQISQAITVTVQNIGGADRAFRSTFFGRVLS